MTTKNYLSGLAIALSAALAVPAYSTPPTMQSGRFVPYRASSVPRFHSGSSATARADRQCKTATVCSTLDSKVETEFRQNYQALDKRVGQLETDVKGLQSDYQKLQQTVADLTQPKPKPGKKSLQLDEDHKQALEQKFDSLRQNRESVDSNCDQSYKTAVGIAAELTATTVAVGLSDEATQSVADLGVYLKVLDSDKFKDSTSYEKATVLTEAITKTLALFPTEKAQPYLRKVLVAYGKCGDAHDLYTKDLTRLEKLSLGNQYETEEQKTKRIETVLRALFPQLLPKENWFVKPIVSGQYNNGWHGKLGAEVCYNAGSLDLCLAGAAMTSSPNVEQSTSQNKSVAQVGPGYQTASASTITTTTKRNNHYSLGPRLGLHLSEGKNVSWDVGLGLELQGGEEATSTQRSRSTQLQDTNGNNLGNAHNIQDATEQRKAFRTLVPTLDTSLCYDNGCIRPSVGYDTDKQAGPLKGFVPGLRLYYKF